MTDIDESVEVTAHMFQQRVAKQYDVRLTAVDQSHFATRIDIGRADLVDWRSDYAGLTYTVLPNIPREVDTGVRELLRRLSLRYAAIDFAVAADDAWYFLDLNANGQSAWLQDATGQAISRHRGRACRCQ